MKKSITILALLGGAVGAYAQGNVLWSGYNGAFAISVWQPQGSGVTEVMGNTASDGPAGSTTYTGSPLGGGSTGSGPTAYGNGNLWTIALYAAPGVNNTAGVLAAEAVNAYSVASIFSTTGGTGAANVNSSGAGSAGNWNSGFPTGPILKQGLGSGTQAGGVAGAPNAIYAESAFTGAGTLQLEAWYNGGSANLTYAAAVAAGDPAGTSAMETINVLGGTGSPFPATTPNLGGGSGGLTGPQFTSFSLVQSTPEPSTIALGVIGASTFLFRRRK